MVFLQSNTHHHQGLHLQQQIYLLAHQMTIYQIIIFHKTLRTILHKTSHMAPLALLLRKPHKALHRKKLLLNIKRNLIYKPKLMGEFSTSFKGKTQKSLRNPQQQQHLMYIHQQQHLMMYIHQPHQLTWKLSLLQKLNHHYYIRKSSGNEYHDYYHLISPTELYSSSDEETSPNHASQTMDHQDQITYPQIDIIGPDLIQEDYEELIKLIATAKDMNVLPDMLLSERTTKCTSERKVALFELLECLQINGQKF